MVQFIDLPDVVLLSILSKLPMWKILQLARLCHRLNHLKQVCFNTKFTHLRLFAGTSVNKFYFKHEKADFFHLPEDFDLIIQFKNQQILRIPAPYSNLTLSEDWFVENVDQISRLAQLLPKVAHLTVVIFTNSPEMPNCCARLLSNWPELKSLSLLNQCPKSELMSDTILPVINSLEYLEHLQIDYGTDTNPVATFAPLLSRTKLKSFICTKTNKLEDYEIINGRAIWSKVDHTVWNGPSEMIQALEDGLDTFGLVNYDITDQEAVTRVSNRTLLRKLKYFQGSLYLYNLAKWDLTDWTALQCVHLDFKSTQLLTNSSLKRVLTRLAVLANLTEFHLDLFSKECYDLLLLLPPETFHNLPRIESVRQFQLYGALEPHQCLPLLASAFPNASELSFRLWSILNTANDNFDSYIKRRAYLHKLCEDCKQTIKRAIDKHGHIIASFHWFLEQEPLGFQQDQLGPSYKVVPKVKLFTKEIAGRIRPNFGCIPIG